MATTAYQAGVESNAVELSYGLETVWGVAPATTFQAIRITSEGLRGQKQRQRPKEINQRAEASAAITTQESADGQIPFALSYGTHDDLLSSLLNSSWSAGVTVTSITTDTSFVAATNKVTSTLNTKFSNVVVGQWLRIASPLNTGYGRVIAKASNQDITLGGIELVDETSAGTDVVLKTSGMIRNSNVFQSLYFQKRLASDMYLRYPGTQITAGTINAQQGQFAQGTFTALAKVETKSTTDASTGGVLPAPTNTVMNTVNEFQQLQLDGELIAAVCRGVTVQITKDGAAADYGLGSPAAQGMRIGDFTLAGGRATFYFRDFGLYDLFKAESKHTFSHRQTDEQGNSYIFTCQAVCLMNPQIVAGGQGQPVIAEFEIEGNPHATFGTFQIDRIAA